MLLDIVKKEIEKVLEKKIRQSDVDYDVNYDIDDVGDASDETNAISLDFDVSYIEEEKFGHVTTNIAMKLAKNENKSPKEVAEKIKSEIGTPLLLEGGQGGRTATFSKIEVAGPGFINFTFSDEFLAEAFTQNSLADILENIKNKNINNLNNRDVLVEYTDPNPFKVFHIGHLMTNIIGESIAGLYELAGAKVKRINYQGDVGRHIAINIYAILKPENKKIFDEMMQDGQSKNNIKSKNIKQKVQWLGEKYAEGYADFDAAEKFLKESSENINTEEYKNSLDIFEKVTSINKKIYELINIKYEDIKEERDKNIKEIYDAGRGWSLEYFETLYKMLGTRFDKYIFESEAAPIGLDIVKNNLSKPPSFGEGEGERPEPIFEVGEEGAIIFDGEKEVGENGKKLHKRVFVNKNGLPTYEAKDLGNMEIKLAYAKENNLDIFKSIVITGNEQSDYFKVLYKAIEKLNPEMKADNLINNLNSRDNNENKLVHFGHGMMKFADGKMSSRKGNIVAGDELIENVSQKLKEKFLDSRVENIEEKNNLIEKVSIASIKYAVLRQAIGRDVIFDMDKVISVEGDSGPYLQYTHARLCAVAKDTVLSPTLSKREGEKPKTTLENKSLILSIEKYQDVLLESINEVSPHKLVTYLTLLCREVNSWYAHNRVVGDSANELIAFKVKEILAHGLKVLAMHAPEKM